MLAQVAKAANEAVELSVDEIDSESFVIRSDFGNLQELADSIKSLGLLEPLIVRENLGKGYQLLAGHRRFRACLMLGMRKVKAIVVNVSDKDAYLIAISENVQRKSLNPIEEAMVYSNYVHKRGWGGITELAKNVGKSPTYIHMMINMLNLPSEVRDKVAKGELKPFVATELEKVKDMDSLNYIVKQVIKTKPSMRKLRRMIDEQLRPENGNELYLKVMDEMIVSTRNCMINYDMAIGKLEDGSEHFQKAVGYRYRLHELLDALINERASVRKALELSGDFA
ncbi:MAG: ParB/RepB/Spo0J family partition protein [Nitrososphaeria archaeon]